MSKLIEMGKKYRTRDGRIARILAIDLNHIEYPVCAAIFTNGEKRPSGFTAGGFYISDEKNKGAFDLIEYNPWSEVEKYTPAWVRYSANRQWHISMFHGINGNGAPFFSDHVDGSPHIYDYYTLNRPRDNG